MDDAFLVKFLRARKFDTQATFKIVKKYFKVRRDHPDMFKDLTPSRIPFDAVCRKHRLVTVSRHRDPMGRMAALLKTEMIPLFYQFVSAAGDEPETCSNILQDCMPTRLKAMYVINNPPIFDFFFAIIKMFLKAKLLKRKMEAPTKATTTNPLERELESEEGYFQELNTYAYHDKPRKTVHFLSD
ncbi:hypothetical protein MTO96_044188 [Rhipicephalus appendiculatus]